MAVDTTVGTNSILDFLRTVITTPSGWLRVLVRGQDECWYQWPLLDLPLTTTTDVYYSPILYKEPGNVATTTTAATAATSYTDRSTLPTRTIVLDISSTNLLYLPLVPTTMVQTSPGRYQAYWIFNNNVDHELVKQLALSIEGVDPTSASPHHLFRLPYTYSSKYPTVHYITPEHTTGTVHTLDELIPTTNGHRLYDKSDLVLEPLIPTDQPFKPHKYMQDMKFSPTIANMYAKPTSDPKGTLQQLILEALKLGVPKPYILALAQGSANNIYKHLKYHQEEELLKYILDLEGRATVPDARPMIETLRRVTHNVEERKDAIATIIKQTMIQTGTFVHTKEGGCWYIPSQGQTLPLVRKSDVLYNYLQNNFGINTTDIDTEHTISVLIAFTSGLPQRSYEQRLSHYDKSSKRLLIHTGINSVWSITQDNIELVPNGSYGVVLFPMKDLFVPVMPRPDELALSAHWSEVLFGPFLDNILNLTHEEARALLSAWLLFLFFKNTAPSRPILAIFGQPGSGKSTTLKRICMFLYGKPSGFSGITTAQDFDHATATLPLAIFDNVDTWEKWLPDRLAQSAATLETRVRKLYTNSDSVIIRRDALVAITAHDPKFSRADVADRLLILNMQRRTAFTKEATLMDVPRSAIWHAIITDLQRVLSTPEPDIPEQLRVEDFAAIGAWCSSALGLLPEFRSAIDKLRGGQRGFAIQGEQLLVDAVITYTKTHATTTAFKPAAQLYNDLEWAAGTNAQAFSRKYRNATAMINKLVATQDALSQICTIESKEDEYRRKLWRILPKQQTTETN